MGGEQPKKTGIGLTWWQKLLLAALFLACAVYVALHEPGMWTNNPHGTKYGPMRIEP
jgi:hypothetical protein